jgi:hypothetical protein
MLTPNQYELLYYVGFPDFYDVSLLGGIQMELYRKFRKNRGRSQEPG